mgnify:CR=1 FL=1
MAKCKNCKHLCTLYNRTKESFKWCSLIDDCPQEDIERNCEYYELMTNADWIRGMTDEELAEFIINFDNRFGEEYEGEQSCLSWLQRESEE